MAGQIIARGRNVWMCRVYVGEVAGKRRYLNKTVHGTKKDAQAWLNNTLRAQDTGMLTEPTRLTVTEYLSIWLTDVADIRVSERTARDYREYAQRYLAPALGDYRLAQLTAAHVQAMYADMLERGLSARTVRIAHAVLRMALDTAVKTNVLARNVADSTTLPKHVRREMKALSPADARRVIAAAKDDHWEAFWLVLLALGLRPGEASALKWSDVSGDRLNIQRSLTPAYRGKWSLHEPKTARSRRVVIMPPMVISALAAHKRRQAEEKLAAGSAYQSHNFVFALADGSPVHPASLSKNAFLRLLARAGVPVVRMYDLRHTSASLALASGEHVKVVSERLGHSSTTMTMDVYSHVMPGMQEDAALRMERILSAQA